MSVSIQLPHYSKWRGPQFLPVVLFGSANPPPPYHPPPFLLFLTLSFLCFAGRACLSQLTGGGGQPGDPNKTTAETLWDSPFINSLYMLHISRAVLVWFGGNIIPDQHWAELDRDRERGAHAHCLYTSWRHLFVYSPQGKSAKMEQNVTANLTSNFSYFYILVVTVSTVQK